MEQNQKIENAINNVFNYLNTLDLTTYLDKFKNKSVLDLMEQLEKDYLYKDDYSEILFDYITEDEFITYLNKKYNTNIKSEIDFIIK